MGETIWVCRDCGVVGGPCPPEYGPDCPAEEYVSLRALVGARATHWDRAAFLWAVSRGQANAAMSGYPERAHNPPESGGRGE